jgi:hypothetical protein
MRDAPAAAAYRRAPGENSMKKPGLFSVIFGLVGTGLLVGAALLAISTRSFIATAKPASGTVIEMIAVRDNDGSVTYKPVVEFTTMDGATHSFASNTSSNPPSYRVGEGVEVLYAPDDPNDARIRGFGSLWLAPIILAGIGTVFASIGFGILIVVARRKRLTEWLQRHGTEVHAEFASVEKNTSLKVNGRSPWRIISQWHNPSTGEVHVFNSENLWFDPESYVTSKQVRVLIDPQDPKRYYVDVSFLPKLAG